MPGPVDAAGHAAACTASRGGFVLNAALQANEAAAAIVAAREGRATVIAWLTRSGPPFAQRCPVLLCDACLEPIQRNDGPGKHGGIVQWVDHADGTQTVVTTHKGKCDRDFTNDMRNIGDLVFWEELDVFMEYLALNTREPFPDEDNVEYVAPAPSTWRQGRYRR